MIETDVSNIKKMFFINLILITVFGSIMVFSSSYIYGKEIYGSPLYYFIRQIVFIAMGITLAFIVGETKFSFWTKYARYINIALCFVLILTLVPGINSSVKGATRWINVFGFKFQPGEFAKIAIILAATDFFQNFYEKKIGPRIQDGLFLLLPLIIFLAQPDFGSFSICFLVIAFVCFMSSFPRKYFYTALVGGFVSGIVLLFAEPYRVKRIFAFLDPWKNAKTSGFQIIQSYLAFANGSLTGLGLGNSNEKLFYLPEAHNDFIFSVVGEEFGLVGVAIVIFAFISLIYLGFKLALSASKKHELIIISSVIFVIGLQTVLNMGVVLGLLPTKGLNLPFISYGGSSMLANFFAVGLILSALNLKKTPFQNKD